MKKVIFILLGLTMLSLFAIGQPTQMTFVTFESGLPSDWTANNTSKVQAISTLASTGSKCVRMVNNTAVVTLTSPTFTRESGCKVRLEFSHIPMLKNPSGAGSVEISIDNGATWKLLTIAGSSSSPTGYDYTYGGGVGNQWDGNFKKIDYWENNVNVPESQLDSTYWKHEVFYLTNALGSATSFKLRFKLAGTTTANTFSGWYLDDIRLYQATQSGNTVRVPQLYSLDEYPFLYNYPNCADAPVRAVIKFTQSNAPSVADSIYLEYKLGSSDIVQRATMTYSATLAAYTASLPFCGYDSITQWRLIINDERYNRLTYPYVYGHWNVFKNIRAYSGKVALATTGLSSQEVMMKTNQIRNLWQFRYSAAELQAKGISAGKMKGLYYNVTQATSGFNMLGFRVYMANIPPSTILSNSAQYTGPDVQSVIASSTQPAPQVGWHELVFDNSFIWDGESDILIKICWDNGNGATIGGTTKIESIPATGPCITHQSYSSTGFKVACNDIFSTADPTFGYRPNFKFDFVDNCKLAIDAGVSGLEAPGVTNNAVGLPVVTAGTPVATTVDVHNYGTEDLHSIQVSYNITNGATTSASTVAGLWSGSLDTNATVAYSFPTSTRPTFTFGFNYLKAWTNILPPEIDWEPRNDAQTYQIIACNGPMSGEYAIGSVAGVSAARSFNNFYEVFKMLQGCGVSGPVTFKINPNNTIEDSLVFPTYVSGMSNANYVKFVSATDSLVKIAPINIKNANVDLSGCSFWKFEKIAFRTSPVDATDTVYGEHNLVLMSSSSSYIEFKKCLFEPQGTGFAYHSAKINGANYITFDSCSFPCSAMTYGIYAKGSSTTNLAQGLTVKNCTFGNTSNAITPAIYVEYSKNINITKNAFSTLTTSSASAAYNILVQNSKEFSITKNRFALYRLNAMGINGVISSTTPSVVANNKISVHNSNAANLTTNSSAIHLISGDNVLIAYNNIYVKDSGGSNVTYGLNLGSPGQSVSNVRVKNNIVVSDGAGMAVYARPTNSSSLKMSNNVYYKKATTVTTPYTNLWKYNNTNCSTLSDWQTACGGDTLSYINDPLFTDWNLLSSTNTFLCYKAQPLTEITDDYNDIARPTDYPCIGAVQFNPPPSNIFVKEVWIEKGDVSMAEDGNTMYSACGLSSENLKVKFSNISANTILPNSMRLWYKVDNASVPATQKDTIPYLIQPDTDYVYTFRLPYNFTVTNTDHKYSIKAFSVLSADTVHANDTAYCYVLSRHQLSALAPHTDTINYGDSILMNIVSNDSIYWFLNSDDATPALKSHEYQTTRLFNDTTFYFSRKEEIPRLKISEIQFQKNVTALGQTVNMPSWLNAVNAVEISNYGNGAVNLKGYKFSYVTGGALTLSNSFKNYTFNDYILPANTSVVFQIANGISSDSSQYINIGSGTTFNASSKAGFLLTRLSDTTIIDAITINNAVFNTASGVPASVWHGAGKMIPAMNTAGIIRTSFAAADSNGWVPSDATHLLTIGTINTNQMVAYDNGCYGYVAPYNIVVSGVPTVDPGVASVSLVGITKPASCTLTDQQVRVKITNTGVSNLTMTPLKLLVYDGATLVQTVEDTCLSTISPNDTVNFVFASTVNLAANTADKLYTLICFSNLASDVIHLNDTSTMSITSLRTPFMPLTSDQTIPYATTATLTGVPNGNNSDIVIWFKDPTTHTELSRTNYTTPILYEADTFYVESMLLTYDTIITGDTVLTNAVGAYPAPMNTSKKNVKEQYLFRASELNALGLNEGNINSLMLKISAISGVPKLAGYTIKVGTTTDETLSSWKTSLTEVCNIDTITLTTTDIGWKTFPFTTPFYYDGVSNLVVQVCFSSISTGNPTVRSYYTITDFNSSLYYTHNTQQLCDYVGSPANNNHLYRPTIRFSVDKFGCPSNRKPVVVNVTGAPSCDGGLSEFISPATTTVMSGLVIPIKVRLKNYGVAPFTALTINWTVNGVAQTPYSWSGSLAPNATDTITLGSYTFTSGNNNLKAWISLTGDTISNNDSVSFDFSACVGNSSSVTTLTVGATGSDYPTISAAVDGMVVSGICGDVVISISPKTGGYNEQVFIPEIVGTDSHTITLQGNATDSNSVILKYNAAANTDQAALKLSGASNVILKNFTIQSYAGTYASLVDVSNGTNNVRFESMVLKSPKVASEVIKLVNFDGVNNNISFNKVHFNGGATSLNLPVLEDTLSQNLSVQNCFFDNFAFNGMNIYSVNNLTANNNKFREYANSNISTALFANGISGTINVIANDIFMKEGSAVRSGIDLRNMTATQVNPVSVINNAISLVGTNGTSNLSYIGLNLDTISYANVYYNTVRVEASKNSSGSRALNIGKLCENIKVLNNNLDNEGKGSAYYVFSPTTQVIQSDNNNLYTNGNILAFWGANKTTLALLQTASSMDASSKNIANPFMSDSVLALSYPSDITRSALSLDDVSNDIVNNFRPITPQPTIGAYEYQYVSTDIGPVEILSPLRTIQYIENTPISISVKIKNFGLFSADTVKLTAILKFKEDTTNIIQTVTQTFIQNIPSMDYATLTITTPINPPLNFRSVADSMHVCIFTTLISDTNKYNDTIHTNFLTIPGYNVQNVKTVPITERCTLYNTNVQVIIKNVGENTLYPTDSIWVGYFVDGRPDLTVRELFHLPYTDDVTTYDSLPKNNQVTYSFVQKANFYPLADTNTTWRLRTYLDLRKDNVKVNDTAAYINVIANVSPTAPIVYDTSIYYGTWAEPRATQGKSLAIKWFADSNNAAPFYSPSTYIPSTKYATTQLFVDSTFYLRTNSTGSYACVSRFSPLHVTIRPRQEYDGACIGLQNQGITEPPKEGWVYMTSADTIKVKLSNYGTTALQNFNISYCIKPIPGTDSTIVTEVCPVSVAPDSSYIYKFNTFADFSDPSKTYSLRTWISVTGDIVHQNDTSLVWLVKPKNGNTLYPPASVVKAASLNITRVQLGNMDNSSSTLDATYSDYTENVTPATLFKGIYDSMYVYSERSSSISGNDESPLGGWVRVFIDWDRDGAFSSSELVLSDTVNSGSYAKGKIVVPSNVINGYTRMRVMLYQGKGSGFTWSASDELTAGEIEDYKVFIRDTWDKNAELVKFVSPNEFLDSVVQDVKVVLRNAGKTTMDAATIKWIRNDGAEQVYNWTGSLASADRTVVTLATGITIPTGMNRFKVWVDLDGDIYHDNDTINRSAYIFKRFTIPYDRSFDEEGEDDDFYAYNANPQLPTNCWEFGTPDTNNAIIRGPYSIPNCWKTKLSGKYPLNNESMLVSPIFDIGIVKADTLSFMMRRAINSGSYMYLEYKNWADKWVRLGQTNDTNAVNWYNGDTNRFTGSKDWTLCQYPLSFISNRGSLGSTVQFRFVFHSGSGNPNDGVAIDDIYLHRAQRAEDIGVTNIAIMPTELPNYGSYFYPKVTVYNYGYAKVEGFKVCYTSQDMHIPQCETITDSLAPGDTLVYTFTNGHYINVNMSNPFNLCAFTRMNPTDLYSDNDSLCCQVVIGPLNKDVALISITAPGNQVVSNNNIPVSIRVKNMGIEPVNLLPVSYKVSGHDVVTELVSFSPPLYNNEEYVYSFNNKYLSSYGAANLKVWVGLEGDYYHDNDTLYKRVEAISSTRDVEANYITIDDYASDSIGIQIAISNNSSIGIDSVRAGYYINGDRSTIFEETYRLATTLPAGQMAYHYFTKKLPRAIYTSVCGYVHISNDNNSENDTTCNIYIGIRDIRADTIYVEHNANENSLVQLRGRNVGSVAGNVSVQAGFKFNGQVHTQMFQWNYTEPNPRLTQYMSFTDRIPRNAATNYNYDIIGWVHATYDDNRSNDTAYVVKVMDYIGLDDEPQAVEQFTLEQNKPNPMNNSTTIDFYLPSAGNTRFFIVNNMGQLIRNENVYYSEGKHQIRLNDLNLTQGVYYYTMEFNGQKRVKKMIVTR